MITRRSLGPAPQEGYQNAPMTRHEAVDAAAELGHLLSARDADGKAIAGTIAVVIRQAGRGYDVQVPAEFVARLVELATPAPAPIPERRVRCLGCSQPLGPVEPVRLPRGARFCTACTEIIAESKRREGPRPWDHGGRG